MAGMLCPRGVIDHGAVGFGFQVVDVDAGHDRRVAVVLIRCGVGLKDQLAVARDLPWGTTENLGRMFINRR